MYRLAIDAGDWSAAARFAAGEDRRMAHLVESCARQVIELKAIYAADPFSEDDDRDTAAVDYVVGCLRQAHMPVARHGDDWWLDVSGSMSFSVFRMLDTHRRRLLRSQFWGGSLAFDASITWISSDGRLLAVPVVDGLTLPIRVGCVPA